MKNVFYEDFEKAAPFSYFWFWKYRGRYALYTIKINLPSDNDPC